MKSTELEKFIQNLSSDLYSFAYVLIPDDLQATQLMIDSVGVFMIQKKYIIEKWTNQREEIFDECAHEIKIHLYNSMYELSKKRYQQLKSSFVNVENNSGFFALEFDDKSVLFLKERTAFSLETIEFILGKTRTEILAHLYSARINMLGVMTSNSGLQNDFRNHN